MRAGDGSPGVMSFLSRLRAGRSPQGRPTPPGAPDSRHVIPALRVKGGAHRKVRNHPDGQAGHRETHPAINPAAPLDTGGRP